MTLFLFAELLGHYRRRRAGGVSGVYLKDWRGRLKRFVENFSRRLGMVTADEIEDWLRGLKPIPQRNDEAPQPLTGKSRDHYRRAIATLFKFGEARGYPARGLGEMDCVTLAKVEHNAVEIFTPAEMRLVPMEANLRAWMEPNREPSGPICEYANVPNQLSGGGRSRNTAFGFGVMTQI